MSWVGFAIRFCCVVLPKMGASNVSDLLISLIVVFGFADGTADV
jgi:hypothetical protein